jgi:hypothetical protein
MQIRNACIILVGIPEGARPLERRMRKWENNIKIDLKVTGCKNVDWIHLA